MKRQHDRGNLLKKAFNLGLTVPEGSRDMTIMAAALPESGGHGAVP